MLPSLDTSTNNIYNIMSRASASMSNVDSNKAAAIGADMQRSIQETVAAAEKGSTDNFKQKLQEIKKALVFGLHCPAIQGTQPVRGGNDDHQNQRYSAKGLVHSLPPLLTKPPAAC